MERHYGMDWLRIGAFAVLILYHTAMVFTPWGFHVKTAQPVEWLSVAMLISNPWRLTLLFVVSGYASRALFAKSGGVGRFLASRASRLLVPLAFGDRGDGAAAKLGRTGHAARLCARLRLFPVARLFRVRRDRRGRSADVEPSVVRRLSVRLHRRAVAAPASAAPASAAGLVRPGVRRLARAWCCRRSIWC